MSDILQQPLPQPIFEVISTRGNRRFFSQPDLPSMQTLLDQHPGMMGPGVAGEASIEMLEGDRAWQFDYVISFMNEFYRKRWCSGGLCGCMGCANRSGGLAALGFTEADWLAWRSRQIQFIGLGCAEEPAL